MFCRLLKAPQQPGRSHSFQETGNVTHSASNISQGAYVITGGLGSLGVLVASWLTQQEPAGSNLVRQPDTANLITASNAMQCIKPTTQDACVNVLAEGV